MDLTVSLLHLAAFLALGLGLPLPNLRRPAMVALALAAVISLAAGLLAPEARTLQTVHHYAGFYGADLEVSMVAFPTGERTAPGWQWPLPFTGFAACWLLLLRGLGKRTPKSAFVLPLLFGWSAFATWLSMQWLAAPAAVIQPAGLERFLWPTGLAMALLSATKARSLLQLIVMTSCAVVLARLPAAIFSKIASDQQLGTVLDVSPVIHIVNPMTHLVFEPPLVAGSADQQFWLIWLEHIIIFPALHSLGLFGIALGVYLWHKHAPEDEAQGS